MSYRDRLFQIASTLFAGPQTDKERVDTGKLVARHADRVGLLEECIGADVQESAHRQRTIAQQLARYVDTLTGCEPHQKADIRGFADRMLAEVDALAPAHAVHDEPAANVVQMPARLSPVMRPVQS